MSTDDRLELALDQLRGLVGELADDAELQRRRGVIAACWPYALRRPMPQIPTQRRPSRAERAPDRAP